MENTAAAEASDESGARPSTRGATHTPKHAHSSMSWPGPETTNVPPAIHHLVENMSEEQWRVVHEALCEPTGVPKLGHLCSNIVQAVTQTIREQLLPTLSRMLGIPVSSLIKSGSVNPSQPSQWSQAAQYQTALCELFEITEDSICKSLRRCLQQSKRDVVRLVLLHVNSVVDLALKQHILKGPTPSAKFAITSSTIRAANDLVRSVCQSTQDLVPTNRVSQPAPRQPITNSDLVTVTRVILNVITDHMDGCMDAGELQEVGRVIAAVVDRVNLLASKNASAPQCSPCENCGGNAPHIHFVDGVASNSSLQSQTLQKLSTENFHAKATKAVGEVLMRNFDCPACLQAGQSKCQEDCKESVGQTASALLETFIEEMQNIADCADSLTSGSSKSSPLESSSKRDADAESFYSDTSMSTLGAAQQMLHKLQSKLMVLYSQLPEPKDCTTNTTGAGAGNMSQVLNLRIDITTRDVVNEILIALFDEESDGHSTTEDCCTKAKESASVTSQVAREFVDTVLAELEHMSFISSDENADSMLCSEEFTEQQGQQMCCFSRNTLSVADFQVLSSKTFFTEATKTVSDTLLKTVQSSTSFSDQTHVAPSGLPKDMQCNTLPQNVDITAFEIIQNFVAEIKLCAASIENLATELRLDKDLLKSGSPFAGHAELEKATQNYVREKVLTSVKTIYSSMHERVQNLFTQYDTRLNPPESESQHGSMLSDQEMVENSTKDLIRQISNMVKTAITPEDNTPLAACVKSSCTSLKSSTFLDDVIHNLKDLSFSAEDPVPPASVHKSASFIEKLSDKDFQTKASQQVGSVLLNSIVNLSQSVNSDLPGNATGDSDNLDNGEVYFFPSLSHSESVAYSLVGDIIEETVEYLMTPGVYTLTESAATDIVASVTKAMKDLFKVKLSSKHGQPNDGDSVKVSQAAATRLMLDRISLTAQRIFGSIKTKVTDCLQRYQSIVHRKKTDLLARRSISEVLVTIQNDLPDPVGAENSEQIKLTHDLLSSMMDEVKNEVVDVDTQSALSQLQSPASHFGDSRPPHLEKNNADKQGTLPPISTDVNTGTEMENILTGRRRVRRFLSEENMKGYSSGLTHQICKILKNSYDPLVWCMPAGRSVSDSFLTLGPSKEEDNYETPVDLVYSCVEESVRRLVLSSFFPLTSNKNQERILRHAFGSASIDISGNSPLLKQPQLKNRSSSKVFRSTIAVVTQVLAKEVMERLNFGDKNISLVERENYDTDGLEHLSELEVQQILDKQRMAGTGSSCSESTSKTSLTVAVETVCSLEDNKVTYSDTAPGDGSHQTEMGLSDGKEVKVKYEERPATEEGAELKVPPSCEYPALSEDILSMAEFAHLTSMLIVRLLNGTRSDVHSDLTANTTEGLIDKIQLLTGLGLMDGQTSPEDLQIHHVYPKVYESLVEEYGSASVLQAAVMDSNSSFDVSLRKLLLKEMNAEALAVAKGEAQGQEQTTGSRLRLPSESSQSSFNTENLRSSHLHNDPGTDTIRNSSTFTTKLQKILKPFSWFRLPKAPKFSDIALCADWGGCDDDDDDDDD
ncbi:uncharacterized protein LOC134463975 isoform X2 [Engraulis encrasicolus]|uniref:uncharacterized protein LOC134463975 isoform X2 n=1 Tax=Engraulis encrasicolus TaxID=184585 RepID=UPI002FD44F4F